MCPRAPQLPICSGPDFHAHLTPLLLFLGLTGGVSSLTLVRVFTLSHGHHYLCYDPVLVGFLELIPRTRIHSLPVMEAAPECAAWGCIEGRRTETWFLPVRVSEGARGCCMHSSGLGPRRIGGK